MGRVTGALLLGLILLAACRAEVAVVRGQVVDEDGQPVEGARVGIQAAAERVMSDAQGAFSLEVPVSAGTVTLSAWKAGYYCAKAEQVAPPRSDVTLILRLYQTTDNPQYEWIPPVGENSCYSCKPEVTQVWLDQDAHSRSAANIRYLNLYNGTDVNGNQSPLTPSRIDKDYGRIPLPPDLSQPYYGPGFKLDFPEEAGNCAACHNPGAAVDAPYATDPNTVGGADAYGIHCDYCHKVADVILDPATGLPYPNRPGVLSQDIRRPFPEDEGRYQLFFGTFDDDNVPQEDTYLPLLRQSQFCAPCHYGVFWNTVIYNSYGEWLESPYSDPQNGKTCQQCHMSVPTLVDGEPLTNVAAGKGGVERDPLTIPAHDFPGAASTTLLQNSVSMRVTARREGGQVSVEVEIVNDRTGHHVPTDSPLRQMILLVQAEDSQGSCLAQGDGPLIPEYGGVGDPAQGYYAGLPGKIYAKILMNLWTQEVPSAAYWNPIRVVSDNRLPAFGSDTSRYTFDAPPEGAVTVRVSLFYRRAFKLLADQKGWNDPDILMEEETISLP